MADNSIIKINSTSYSVQESWLAMATKLFNLNPEDPNSLNILKAGLFGYNNEISSNEIKNNVYHRNVLYDEHFLNSASIPHSIYNFAKMYNVGIGTAKPSHVFVNFAMSKYDLVNHKARREIMDEGTVNISGKRTYELIINNQFPFSIKDINFLLPFPVQIIMKETNDNDYAITARYKIDGGTFPFMEVNNPFIKTWQDNFQGEKYVFLGLDLYQLDRHTQEFMVMSEDISDNLFYNVAYEGQLSYFNVYYTYKGERTLLKAYFNNAFNPPDNEKFCYFSYLDDDKLQISFSALPNSFRPRFDSKIEVEFFTTLGEKGNFSYQGKVLYNFATADEFVKTPVYVTTLTDASGGRNKLDMTGTKNQIIEEILTRKNLITEADLDLFFNNLNTTNTLNGSSISFIKKQDDILKRMFSCFLLMRDDEKKVLPTNTAPKVLFDIAFLEANSFSIPENSVIIYDYSKNIYFHEPNFYHDFHANGDKIPSKYEGDNFLIYATPYLIRLDRGAVVKSNYYNLYVDVTESLIYKYVNDLVIENFNVKDINIKKESIEGDSFKVSLTLNTNINTLEIDNRIKLRGILKSKNEKVYGFFDFERESAEDYKYVATLTTNRDMSYGLNLYNSLYNISGSAEPSDILTNCYIEEDIYMDIAILYKDPSATTFEKYDSFQRMKDIGDYTTAIVVRNDNPVKFYEDLSYIMSSIITPKSSSGKITGFEVENIPIVGFKYYYKKNKIVYKTLNVYCNILKSNIKRLENNTTLDLKLTNSYGPSRYYYISSYVVDDVVHYNNIKSTDLLIDLDIHIQEAPTEEDDLKIKQFISDFIESCNEDQLVPISNMIRLLEQNFDIIRYIEFNGISGNDIQKIESSFTSFREMTKQQIIEYVPEYLNVKKELNDFMTKNESGEDIHLGTFYEFNIKVKYI